MRSELGVGSSFWFTLDLPVAAKTDSSTTVDPTHTEEAPLAGHVLIVEDNRVNQRVAEKLLARLGLTSEIAENGRVALERLAGGSFDALLMDCQMPEMDGFEATRCIRTGRAADVARIPIIAMTANAMSGDRQRCIDAGMDDYISKPVALETLEATLRRWLDGRPDRLA